MNKGSPEKVHQTFLQALFFLMIQDIRKDYSEYCQLWDTHDQNLYPFVNPLIAPDFSVLLSEMQNCQRPVWSALVAALEVKDDLTKKFHVSSWNFQYLALVFTVFFLTFYSVLSFLLLQTGRSRTTALQTVIA
jgi:hypothetical protein